MGIANIIPGVSGGTMILAMGLYERFVHSIAEITRFRFRIGPVGFLATLGLAAVVAVFAMVEPINWGLTYHQHVMFSLFMGLTLGGVPLLWRSMSPISPTGLAGATAGLVFMVAPSFALTQLDLPASILFLFFGGVVGSAAMVLPGLSGSYLLLALGLYFPITEGLSRFKDALGAMDVSAAMDPALGVILPVGLGVIAGVVGLTNLLKAALERFHQSTMGVLLGLLLGSVFFLYPFREPGHKDPFEAAAPMTPANVGIVLLCLVLGFVITFYISRIGENSERTA
jgi:putative membrane protein